MPKPLKLNWVTTLQLRRSHAILALEYLPSYRQSRWNQPSQCYWFSNASTVKSATSKINALLSALLVTKSKWRDATPEYKWWLNRRKIHISLILVINIHWHPQNIQIGVRFQPYLRFNGYKEPTILLESKLAQNVSNRVYAAANGALKLELVNIVESKTPNSFCGRFREW